MDMKKYLTDLITEKGRDLDDEIEIEGHMGLTWNVLIDYIVGAPDFHQQIRDMLVMIDFKNGDVFDYLTHLTKGMLVAQGFEVDI